MTILHINDPLRKGPNHFPSASGASLGKPLPDAWTRAIPGEEATTPAKVYEASIRLVEAGLSVIPIEAYEGSKSPDNLRLPHPRDRSSGRPRPSWSTYQIRRPKPDELRRWYEMDGRYGLAVLGGTVSGGEYGLGLEVIDLDNAEVVNPWIENVEKRAPGLISRLIRVRTPRPGLHVYYRCSGFGGSQKLAFADATDDLGQIALDSNGHPVRKTLIEVKGEGGYCLIPPSPPRCHPSCRLYQYVDGSADLSAVPTITSEERAILLDAARGLSRIETPTQVRPPSKSTRKNQNLCRPGDDFNARGKWSDILTKHGRSSAGEFGDETRWCRPGKDDGVSATTNHQGSDLLHVFSSNANPFEPEKSYAKFTAYTLLNHDGNFIESARDLGAQGYGAKTIKAGKR